MPVTESNKLELSILAEDVRTLCGEWQVVVPFDESAPPPWNLVAQGWWFLQNNPSSLDVTQGGYYHSLELETTRLGSNHDEQGLFKGGLAIAQVYRYLESPVGPYDELIIVPGKYTNPVDAKEYARISRIYVSSERSVYNGRKNWNIPKHLARFRFTLGPSGSTKIEVFSMKGSESESEPFFSAISTPSSWIPSFPFKTSWSIQDLTIVQPPLQPLTEAQRASITEDSENPDTLTVGEQEWSSILCEMSGRMRVCYYEPGLSDGEEYGDGVGYPKIRPWKIGLEWLPGMKMVFPESKKLQPVTGDDKKTK